MKKLLFILFACLLSPAIACASDELHCTIVISKTQQPNDDAIKGSLSIYHKFGLHSPGQCDNYCEVDRLIYTQNKIEKWWPLSNMQHTTMGDITVPDIIFNKDQGDSSPFPAVLPTDLIKRIVENNERPFLYHFHSKNLNTKPLPLHVTINDPHDILGYKLRKKIIYCFSGIAISALIGLIVYLYKK